VSELISSDGTTIGVGQTGNGPPLVLVDGALCHRGFGPSADLSAALASEFTVVSYDRRGRGESGDTPPYAPEREIEDLAVVIAAVGGSAFVYGISSGAALAMEAAARGVPITRLALFEPPFTGEFEDPRSIVEEHAELDGLLAADRCGEAVERFLGYMMPPEIIVEMRDTPAWADLEAIAPTLRYDNAVMGDGTIPRERAQLIEVPTLLMAGSASPEILRESAAEVARAIPGASLYTLEGETHTSEPAAEIAALRDFLG
jgi:pimeloyl-ACP methyl ester carboxylesterase